MTAHPRHRAPGRHGEILAVPSLETLPRPVDANRRVLAAANVLVDGLPLRELRILARREVLHICEKDGADDTFDADRPLLITGHQPELSHPGVWVKNFLLHGLAAAVGGIPLNLIVDNDTLKSASLRLPAFQPGDPASVHLESLAFDVFGGAGAYENHPIRDPSLFRSFPARADEITRNWGYEPLLPRVWQEASTTDAAFIAMRRDRERAWGCRNFEMRVSRLSHTMAFARFTHHILSDLPRFREVYNAALWDYRRNNGIRSSSHPAPDLGEDEAPFWEQTANGRRRASRGSDPRNLRPRALTFTLFARVCLGDFFIHGIGGGKYDEVTDRIIQDYFRLEPPAYQVLSATLLPPLPVFSSTPDDLERGERHLRDLYWNPQRHLAANPFADPAVGGLRSQKDSLILSEPPLANHAARREWFHSLQTATERLRPFVADQEQAAVKSLDHVRAEVHANAILRRRDYPWVFYPEETLRPFLQKFLRLIGVGRTD